MPATCWLCGAATYRADDANNTCVKCSVGVDRSKPGSTLASLKVGKLRWQADERGGGDGTAHEGIAGKASRPACGGGGERDEDGGEGKDASNPASSSPEGIAPFELAVGVQGDGTPDSQVASAAAVPWTVLLGKPGVALRKRSGRAVKLVPVEEDVKGTKKGKDGSIILRDETLIRDRVYARSPRLGRCLDAGFGLVSFLFGLVQIFAQPALPFAILKFTNTTDVLFDPNGPPWWVSGGWVDGWVDARARMCVCVVSLREWVRAQ